MESVRALTAMEKRRLMDLARVVPETLLLVGTTEEVFASIEAARELLGVDTWGYGEVDDPDSSSSSAGGGVSLNTTRGNLAGLWYHNAGSPSSSARGGVSSNTTCGSLASLRYDDSAADPDLDPDFSFDIVDTALPPDGLLPEAYCEITRLVSLHGEAGRVLVLCAERLGIQPGGAHNLPDHDAAWKRWRDLRASVVRHAHDALLRLSAAASAVAAAEDIIRWQPVESPHRNGWSSAARQLVRDARLSLDEAKNSVGLMRDAVVREYFETWMILNRA